MIYRENSGVVPFPLLGGVVAAPQMGGGRAIPERYLFLFRHHHLLPYHLSPYSTGEGSVLTVPQSGVGQHQGPSRPRPYDTQPPSTHTGYGLCKTMIFSNSRTRTGSTIKSELGEHKHIKLLDRIQRRYKTS